MPLSRYNMKCSRDSEVAAERQRLLWQMMDLDLQHVVLIILCLEILLDRLEPFDVTMNNKVFHTYVPCTNSQSGCHLYSVDNTSHPKTNRGN